MKLASGARIGAYEIVARIGRGGMGAVYRARDVRLGRDVALKFLDVPPGVPDSAERFAREARAASALNHPHIVTVHDVGETDACPFIVMELVEGRTLRSVIAEQPSIQTAVRLATQIAQALAAAHAAGIVHRDLKPENLMVRQDGRVKVLDFGLARLTGPAGASLAEACSDAVTKPGALLGTTRYMSPEQARGDVATAASDVFSMGLIVYELLTGRHPFAAPTASEVVRAIVDGVAIAPSRVNAEVPDALDELVDRMLAKRPADRPSAAEVESRLEGAAAAPAAAATQQRVREAPATVGRERQREALRAALEESESGRGLIVCVTGEPGIGKTTLVEEFLAQLAGATAAPAVARGRCSERLAGADAYLPWLEALESLARATAGDAARVMKLVAPDWFAQLGLGLRSGDAGGTPAGAAAPSPERVKRELAAFLEELTRSKPTVLFFDDLHWADASTVDMLGYLATRFDRLPLLIVVTYRPTELQLGKHPFAHLKLELEGRGACRELALDFLGRDDVERYLGLAFPDHHFPPTLASLIHAKTEGSPLFVVDLLHYLRDRGNLARQEGHWVLTRSPAEIADEVPLSVRSMVQRKLDQLGDDDRRLLTAASVQGHDFDSAVVAEALRVDAADVEERLGRLERVHALIRRVGESELPDRAPSLRYRFVHVLYQNAFYGNLGPSRRTALSAAVAEALIAHYRERRSQIAADLAVLFDAARDAERASQHFLLAAEHAERVFAYQEVIVLARRGLECLESLPDDVRRARTELALQMALGRAFTATRGHASPAVAAAYARARELCSRLGDHSQMFPVLCGSLAVHFVGAEHRAARQLGEELFRLATAAQDAALLVHAHYALGDIDSAMGEFTSALAHYDRAVELCDQLDPRSLPLLFGQHPAVTARCDAALTHAIAGRPDRALELTAEALSLARALSHSFSEAFALQFRLLVLQIRGDWQAAMEAAEALIALSVEEAYAYWKWTGFVGRGRALAERDAAAGVAQIREGIEALRAAGAEHFTTLRLAWLAEALARAGDVSEALRIVEEGLRFAERTGERYHEAELRRLEGELILATGTADASRAEAAFRQAIDIAGRQCATWWELRATTALARLQATTERRSEARLALARICERITEGADTADVFAARALLETYRS
jgi:predicted ATPase